ncbi:hypothetical protein BRD56_05115 [Thermoplasmatales archaeon SW_10_69_26]|nr:MAG: hypothetical protein BRD56_05115 [Thermoplasmatales archaeon SW_10_69_26]
MTVSRLSDGLPTAPNVIVCFMAMVGLSLVLWAPGAEASAQFQIHTIADGLDAAFSVDTGDMDGDGATDVVVAERDSDAIRWYENDGGGSSTEHTVTSDLTKARSVSVAEINGDTHPDVVGVSREDNLVNWYRNDGGGSFTEHTISTAPDEPKSVATGDVDEDGDIDALSASRDDSRIAWYENDGSGSFEAHTITTDADGGTSVTTADVDSDGDTDILSSSKLDNRIAWYENDGSESFTTHTVTSEASHAKDVTTADVNSDGHLDILSAASDDNEVTWYENDGTESFSTQIITTEAENANTVRATDMDRDGDVDVLSASNQDDTVALYENDGSESFTTHILDSNQESVNDLALVDLEEEGDVDVFAPPDGQVTWFENTVSAKLPDTPRNFAVEPGPDPTDIATTWDPPEDTVSVPLDHYNIYRGKSSDGLSKVTETTDSSYPDTDLDCSTTYYYEVTAVNEDGLESEPTDTKSITIDCSPTPPRNLDLEPGMRMNAMKLWWTEPQDSGSAPIDQYPVYRKIGDNPFAKVGTAEETSFMDKGLECDQTYHYHVTAVNEDGFESEPSASTTTQESTASLDIPWAPENPNYAPSAPATPTLGYEDSASAAELSECPGEDKMVEFSIDSGAFDHYDAVDANTVPLNLDLNAHLRIPSGNVTWNDTPRDVATVQINDSEEWTTLETLDARPEDPNQSTTAWNVTRQDVRVPTEFLSDGENEFRVVFEDFPEENKTGWNGTVDAARLDLVAPPTFILHGWDASPNAALTWNNEDQQSDCAQRLDLNGLAQWQCDLHNKLLIRSLAAFGQNPWTWAADEDQSSRAAMPLFGYNPKQGINQTVADLHENVTQRLDRLDWNGQASFVGHSMGGLVSRTYSVSDCPSSPRLPTCPLASDGTDFRANRIVTLGTPHLGSQLADIYTCQPEQLPFGIANHDYSWGPADSDAALLDYQEDNVLPTSDCGWHDYYASGFAYDSHCSVFGCDIHSSEDAGAYKHTTPGGDGLSYLADFQIRTQGPDPATTNTFLRWLNKEYATLAENQRTSYYAIAGDCDANWLLRQCDGWKNAEEALGTNNDGIVPLESALKTVKGPTLEEEHPHLARNADSSTMLSAVCTGSQYEHNNLHSTGPIQALSLAGLAETVGETRALENTYDEDCGYAST